MRAFFDVLKCLYGHTLSAECIKHYLIKLMLIRFTFYFTGEASRSWKLSNRTLEHHGHANGGTIKV